MLVFFKNFLIFFNLAFLPGQTGTDQHVCGQDKQQASEDSLQRLGVDGMSDLGADRSRQNATDRHGDQGRQVQEAQRVIGQARIVPTTPDITQGAGHSNREAQSGRRTNGTVDRNIASGHQRHGDEATAGTDQRGDRTHGTTSCTDADGARQCTVRLAVLTEEHAKRREHHEATEHQRDGEVGQETGDLCTDHGTEQNTRSAGKYDVPNHTTARGVCTNARSRRENNGREAGCDGNVHGDFIRNHATGQNHRQKRRQNQTATDTNMYGRYLAERDAEIANGATHYTAADCRNGTYEFALPNGVVMTILDSYYYYNEAPSENDYSVCTLFTYGDYNYLFTGDLEEEGEEHLVEMNDLPEVTLYKAGHHGSKTSSSSALLEVIKPQHVCICCCAGSPEYTDTDANQFPTQAFIDRIAAYTDKVYVTSRCIDYDEGTFAPMNGNITVITDKNGISIVCGSGDSRVLKEWEWFKEHRTCPAAWAN